MDNNHKIKKEYLIRMFNCLSGENIGLEEYESIMWYELRGYTTDEAKKEVLNKYRQVLLRDNDIVDSIVQFDDIYSLFQAIDENVETDETIENGEKYYKEFIEYISSRFCGYDFTVVGNELIDDPKGVINEMREVYIAHTIVKSLVREREYKESQLRQYENLTDTPATKAEKLGRNITPYGFLDLPKTKNRSDESKTKIIELIANNSLPYAVAMLDFLGFIKHLKTNYFEVEGKLFKEISKYLGSDLDGRRVKGNYYTLNDNYKEDKKRYTAYKHREKVVKDYETLK